MDFHSVLPWWLLRSDRFMNISEHSIQVFGSLSPFESFSRLSSMSSRFFTKKLFSHLLCPIIFVYTFFSSELKVFWNFHIFSSAQRQYASESFFFFKLEMEEPVSCRQFWSSFSPAITLNTLLESLKGQPGNINYIYNKNQVRPGIRPSH